MSSSASVNMKVLFGLPALLTSTLLFGACTGFKSNNESTKSTTNPWTQGVGANSSTSSDATSGQDLSVNSYCFVTIPDSLAQDQELRVSVSTRNVAKFQVSADGAPYIDLETANGVMTWPGNTFAVGNYSLRFRGLASDLSVVSCNPTNKAVSVTAVVPPSPPTTPNPGGSTGKTVFSLHQLPVQYNIRSELDSGGNLIFHKTEPLTGFRNQFPPYGVPGCVMGYPEYRSECETVGGGFGFDLKGITYYQEFRVYVPAGTTFFGLSGYLPQAERYAVAVRFGMMPSRSQSLSEAEYERAKTEQNRNTDFAKLLAGEERLMVHDGGGSISFSGIARLSSTPLSQGQWLYVRVLNGSAIHGLGAIYEVNLDIYKREYGLIKFSSLGDPL